MISKFLNKKGNPELSHKSANDANDLIQSLILITAIFEEPTEYNLLCATLFSYLVNFRNENKLFILFIYNVHILFFKM